ncbi:MAG: hypothetical protein ACQESN_10650 [Thermotogota bacterium]
MWITSFNLSVYFLEYYILPAVYGLDVPKDINDFAVLQEKIAEEQDLIDIRVFADKNVIEPEEKRTSVEIHTIDNSLFQNKSGGFFHPKIIYLSGIDKSSGKKKHYIFTGSANLTIAGWSRNEEIVAEEEIRSQENLDSLYDFFSIIFKINRLKFSSKEDFIIESSEYEDWTFFHSFSGKDFLNELLPDSKTLTVFSPYFSAEPIKLCKSIKSSHKEINIKLYPGPDVGRIRLTKSKCRELNKENIEVLIRKNFDSSRLYHSKLWITDNKTAVGSWNMTEAGTGSVDIKNTEAGIIYYKPYNPSKDTEKFENEPDENFMSEEEITNDKLNEKNTWLNIRVFFDWEIRTYSFDIDGNSKKQLPCLIKLPGVKELKELKVNADGDIEPDSVNAKKTKDIVKTKIYSLFKDDKVIQSGWITERNISYSPLYEYETMDDLLFSLASGKKDKELEKPLTRENGRLSGEYSDDSDYMSYSNTEISYFTMFRAFISFRNKFRELIENNNIQLFEKYIYTYPGSLTEINEKIKDTVENYDKNNNSRIYVWSMLKEFYFIIGEILSNGNTDKLSDSVISFLNELKRKNIDLTNSFEEYYFKNDDMDKFSRFYKKFRNIQAKQ